MSHKVIMVNAVNARSGGAMQVAVSLLHHWLTHNSFKWVVAASPQVSLQCKDVKALADYWATCNERPTKNIAAMSRAEKKMNQLWETLNVDLVITIFGPAWWRPKGVHICGFANGFYLFPKSDFITDYFKSKPVKRFRYRLNRFIVLRQLKKEADFFWVETVEAASALNQALRINKQKIFIIPNTYSDGLSNFTLPSPRQRSPFIWAVPAAYYPHKQLELLPDIIDVFRKRSLDFQFHVCLVPSDLKRIFPDTIPAEIVNWGSLPTTQLSHFYEKANAIFLPTRLEIFSAVYPEALQCQLPIVTSNLMSAKNVCGDAALYFSPKDKVGMTEVMMDLMTDEALYNDLVEKGKQRLKTFITPQEKAQLFLQQFKKILQPSCAE